jgi:Tol biopolymer transport system component
MRASESIQHQALVVVDPVRRKYAIPRFARFSWLAATFLAIVLSGCGFYDGSPVSSGRWAKHWSGGSYIGAKPEFSPDGSSVVYSTPATGHGDLYRFDLRTKKNVRLTQDPGYEGYPVISPAGTILLVREKKGIGHLWTIDADGGNQKQLTDGPMDDSDASYSADGKSILFVRVKGGIGHIWVMDSDGKNQKQLTDGPWYHGYPTFSPDGKRVVFNRMVEERPYFTSETGPASLRMPELFTMNTDGSELRRLTHNWGYEGPVAFSPDGNRIYFHRTDEYAAKNKFQGIAVMDADGSNSRDIHTCGRPAISSDGRRIAIAVSSGVLEGHPVREIRVMNAGSTDLRTVHTCGWGHDELALSRDGSQLVSAEWFPADLSTRIVVVDLNTSSFQTIPKID